MVLFWSFSEIKTGLSQEHLKLNSKNIRILQMAAHFRASTCTFAVQQLGMHGYELRRRIQDRSRYTS